MSGQFLFVPMSSEPGTPFFAIPRERIPTQFKDVVEFHERFGINYDGPARMLPLEVLHFRLKFLREELKEYEDACDACRVAIEKGNDEDIIKHLANALDALADLTYVVFGTAHLHGFKFDEAFARVHKANMAKVLIADADSTAEERMKLKIQKPEGWQAPDHSDLVQS